MSFGTEPGAERRDTPTRAATVPARDTAGFTGISGGRLGYEILEPVPEEHVMAACEVCGNDYDKSFEVIAAGARHVFDSFECAIHRMAPVCEHCGCQVIGHGTEVS